MEEHASSVFIILHSMETGPSRNLTLSGPDHHALEFQAWEHVVTDICNKFSKRPEHSELHMVSKSVPSKRDEPLKRCCKKKPDNP